MCSLQFSLSSFFNRLCMRIELINGPFTGQWVPIHVNLSRRQNVLLPRFYSGVDVFQFYCLYGLSEPCCRPAPPGCGIGAIVFGWPAPWLMRCSPEAAEPCRSPRAPPCCRGAFVGAATLCHLSSATNRQPHRRTGFFRACA